MAALVVPQRVASSSQVGIGSNVSSRLNSTVACEMETLGRLVRGLCNREIAAALTISLVTAKLHVG